MYSRLTYRCFYYVFRLAFISVLLSPASVAFTRVDGFVSTCMCTMFPCVRINDDGDDWWLCCAPGDCHSHCRQTTDGLQSSSWTPQRRCVEVLNAAAIATEPASQRGKQTIGPWVDTQGVKRRSNVHSWLFSKFETTLSFDASSTSSSSSSTNFIATQVLRKLRSL